MSEFVPEGWAISPLGNVIKQIIDFRGRTPKKLSMEWGGGNIRALSANNVQMGKVNFQKECYLASEDLYQMWMTKGSTEKGDVLFTMEAPLGNVALVPNDDKYILSQRVILLKNDKNKVLSGFLYQQLRSEKFQNVLRENATGSTALGIQQKRLVTLDVVLPPLPEQQKIAAILTSVDEVIEKTQAQINKLKDLKTGMMQELLTRGVGVDGKPHTEFKDSPVGRIPKGWEVVPLGDKVSLIPGYAFKSSDFVNQGISLIRMGNLYKNQLDLTRASKFLPEKFVQDHPKFVVKENDIVFSMTGTSGKEDYGFAVQIPKGTRICLLNQRVAKVVASENITTNYLLHIMRSRLFLDEIYAVGAGTKQANLSSINILSVILPFPSIEEQTKIANALDLIDCRITVINKQFSKLKSLKKALMQDLLTGKVRVKVDTE